MRLGEKTYLGMLPQFQALKEAAVDKLRDKHETGCFPLDNQQTELQLVEGRGSQEPVGSALTGKSKMSVFVLDKHQKPLMPCSYHRAKQLLKARKAVVHKIFPFVIRLKERIGGVVQPVRLKIDPGSKVTGIALVRESVPGHQSVLHLAELQHRGAAIRDALSQRSRFRRRRRGNLRYRAERFLNRATVSESKLMPSLQHRVDSTMSWVARYRRYLPITKLSQELVKFDIQCLENAEISGIEYTQGTLAGTELREYILERDDYRCQYCGAKDVPLNLDHVCPRSRGGSLRPSNLVAACVPCNEKKGKTPVEVFLRHNQEILTKIKAQIKKPLRDAAVVNGTRRFLSRALEATGLPLEVGTGGRTKWNRTRFSVAKSHGLDAACVGVVEFISKTCRPTLMIKANGRGAYKRTNLDAFGFPRGYLMRTKSVKGFQTGDMVRAVVPKGKHAGTHVGRVAVRASGMFNIQTNGIVRQSISHKHMRILQRNDGYSFSSQ